MMNGKKFTLMVKLKIDIFKVHKGNGSNLFSTVLAIALRYNTPINLFRQEENIRKKRKVCDAWKNKVFRLQNFQIDRSRRYWEPLIQKHDIVLVQVQGKITDHNRRKKSLHFLKKHNFLNKRLKYITRTSTRYLQNSQRQLFELISNLGQVLAVALRWNIPIHLLWLEENLTKKGQACDAWKIEFFEFKIFKRIDQEDIKNPPRFKKMTSFVASTKTKVRKRRKKTITSSPKAHFKLV